MIGWLKKRALKSKLQEPRELPVGMTAFHEWSDRIISGAALPATPESQKYCLANMLLNLKPTCAFETDVYFIHALRKFAINQVADEYRKATYVDRKSRGDGHDAQGVAPIAVK